MNRSQRRRLPKQIRAAAAAARCPDCNSISDVAEAAPGVYYVQIAHDDTCPWFTAYQKEHQR